jgi:hypothetical protein
MMRRTAPQANWAGQCLIRGNANTGMTKWAGEHSQYLKTSPGNHTFGFEHDGVSSAYGTGFKEVQLPFLARFRYNVTEAGACPLALRHPSRHKYVHWMEVSRMRKFWQEHGEHEPWNMILIAWVILVYTALHCYRYAVYHNQHSFYAMTAMPAKNSVQMRRYEQYHPMDKPSFRYYQSVPEVWSYAPQRDMYKMGIIANDPYQAACEANGQTANLVAESGEKKFNSETGPVAALRGQWQHKYEAWKDQGKKH